MTTDGRLDPTETLQLRTTVAQLEHALSSRIIIEQAKGVIAVLRDITPDEAFVLLRHQARSTRRNIHEVATEIVAARKFAG
jgi:AmiR/NasT family two-component response regulator